MKDKMIKNVLMGTSLIGCGLGLSACTVNSSNYNMKMNTWKTDVTVKDVQLQSRVVPKYDYHFIWLGVREISRLDRIEYRVINKNDNHVCASVEVNSVSKPLDEKNYWNENVVSGVTLMSPHEIKDMGFYLLPRNVNDEIASELATFGAYREGDGFTCEKPNDLGGCYITTAMCRDTGKADDCAELQTLRKYRDEVMLQSLEGRNLVKEYYSTAPQLVSLINKESDHYQIYQMLREHYIVPAAQAADAGKNAEALELYRTMVEFLSKKYERQI